MLVFILFGGNYSVLVFVFIAAFILLPPIIFRYSIYPERSIYFFFIIWITFPKFIRSLPFIGVFDLPGISYFDIIETTMILHISILMLLKGTNLSMPNRISRLTKLFFFTMLISTIIGVVRYNFVIQSLPHLFLLGNVVEDYINPFNGLIVFLGLFAFINKSEQVEKVLGIFAISGLLIFLDYLILNYFGLFNFLSFWITKGARHGGIFFNDYQLNGLFCIISSPAILYFIIKRKRYYLIPFVLLLLLPVHQTYQRAIYIGFITGLVMFAYIFNKRIRLKKRILFATILIIFISIGSYFSNNLKVGLNDIVSEDIRKGELSDPQSLHARFGAWLRSADLFIYTFPFGSGEGMSPLYYNARFVPQHTSFLLTERAGDMYWTRSTGSRTTKAHNIYIHFITEHGILGLIVLIAFLKTLFGNLSLIMRRKGISEDLLFVATISAIIFGIGTFYMFESARRLYFLYGLLLFLSTFILYSKKIFNSDLRNEHNE